MKWRCLAGMLVAMAIAALTPLQAGAQAPTRFALVIGNADYRNAPQLRTPVADAAAVAETMRAAGYDVTELTDIRAQDIGQGIREFLDRVAAGGPQAVAFVYFAGYALQTGGDNFLLPVDAEIREEADIPSEGFRLSDLMAELAGLQAAARIVVIDGARDPGFGRNSGRPVAPGLALIEPPPGTLVAFSAAPGDVAADGDEDNSLYAAALVSLMRQPGLDIEQIFKATRVQVNEETNGAQTPWMASTLDVELVLFDQPQQAQPSRVQTAVPYMPPRAGRSLRREDLAGLTPAEAYRIVIEIDRLQTYQWFVELFPRSQYAAQVWDIIAVRREAILWRRALVINTPRAYWNYLVRYPNGRFVREARVRLSELSADPMPPPNYVVEAEPLPPGYDDEGVGVAEIVPEGAPPPPRAFFGAPPPFFAPPPPPRVVQPYRPHRFVPPPPPVYVPRPPRFVARPPRPDGRPVRQWVRPPDRPVRSGRPGGVPPRVSLPPSAGPRRSPVGTPPSAGPPQRGGPRPGVTLPPRGSGSPPPSAGQPGLPPAGRPGARDPRQTGTPPTGQPPRSGRIPPTPSQQSGGSGQPPRQGVVPSGQPPQRGGRVPPQQGGRGVPPQQGGGAPPQQGGRWGPPQQGGRTPPPSSQQGSPSTAPRTGRPGGTPPQGSGQPSRSSSGAPAGRPAGQPTRPPQTQPVQRSTPPQTQPAQRSGPPPQRPQTQPTRPPTTTPPPARSSAPPPQRPQVPPPQQARPPQPPPTRTAPPSSSGTPTCRPPERLVNGRCVR